MGKIKDRGVSFTWMFEQIIERQEASKKYFIKFLEKIVQKKNIHFIGDLEFFSKFVDNPNKNVFEQITLEVVSDEEEL